MSLKQIKRHHSYGWCPRCGSALYKRGSRAFCKRCGYTIKKMEIIAS